MNKFGCLVIGILLTVSVCSAAPDHKYTGVSKCKMCHSSEAKGNQYKHWLDSKHAKAYETLSTAVAKQECLKCHVTIAGEEANGVQCESCHGPGSDYKSLSVMQDKEKAIAAGLIMPTKEVCVSCHNEESPNYVEFNYDEFYKKIAHPAPKS
jgi:hypothetical protein